MELSTKVEKQSLPACLVLDRLLVIGSSGLVGSKVATNAQSDGFEVYCTQYTRKSSLPHTSRLDISDRESTLSLVREIRPHVIINTAALTNVDYCEGHKEEAKKVNVDGTRNLVEAARVQGSRLIHISSDSVFDGANGPYVETDPPHPINYYSETKFESEKLVSQLPSYAIARPSVVFGWTSSTVGNPSASAKSLNFGMFVLDKLANGEEVKAVNDQFSTPTFADNLAIALLRLARVAENGTFHTAGKTCLSRYQFATMLAEVFGYATTSVRSVRSSDLRQLATRPVNSCLRVEKAEKLLGIRFLSAQEGVEAMLKAVTP